MNKSEDLLSLELEAFDAAPDVFDSTLKSFDVEALTLKRGFRVKQTLNTLRTVGQLNQELQSRLTGSYEAISVRPGTLHE